MKKALIPGVLVVIFGVFVIGYIGNKDKKSMQHTDKKSEQIENFPKQIGEYLKRDVGAKYYNNKGSAYINFISNETEVSAKACFYKQLSRYKNYSQHKKPKKIRNIEGRYLSYDQPNRNDSIFGYLNGKKVILISITKYKQPTDSKEDIEKQIEKDLALFIEALEIYN